MNETRHLIVKALEILSEGFVNAPPNIAESMEYLGVALEELHKLEVAVNGAVITPDATVQELVAVIEDMRCEYKLHGQITDASARWLIKVKPKLEGLRYASAHAQAKQDDPNKQLYAVVLHFMKDAIAEVPVIVNTGRPYLVKSDEVSLARTKLEGPGRQVVIADKATLLANSFDLSEEDFSEPLLIIGT